MSEGRAILLLLIAAAATGCSQTVWIHPEASAQKYREDHYLCRYGEARPSEEDLRGRGQARSEEVPPQIIVPESNPRPTEVNSGSGTNVNVNVDVGDAKRPLVVPGRSPRRPKFAECMDILGWWPERRSGASVPYARPRSEPAQPRQRSGPRR